jgi:hypothetical protein
MNKGMKTPKRTHDRAPDAEPATSYLDLAGEAMLAGMTREQVIAQLVSRIKRDQGYLAYRKATGRKTRYDEQVTSDLRALALATVLLEGLRDHPASATAAAGVTPVRPGHPHPQVPRTAHATP